MEEDDPQWKLKSHLDIDFIEEWTIVTFQIQNEPMYKNKFITVSNFSLYVCPHEEIISFNDLNTKEFIS